MRYQSPTFTLPTAPAGITVEAYGIAVGLRCPKCHQLWTSDDTHTCPTVVTLTHKDYEFFSTLPQANPQESQ